MILGGPTDGDSKNARKSRARAVRGMVALLEPVWGPKIVFGSQDRCGVDRPHNDALVITGLVANFEVARVFIDCRSLVDGLVNNVFRQMNAGEYELKPVYTSLVGFTGDTIKPMGMVQLPVTLGGGGEQRRTRAITFLVVDAPLAYNIILGSPTLVAFEAVISIPHMKSSFRPAQELGR